MCEKNEVVLYVPVIYDEGGAFAIAQLEPDGLIKSWHPEFKGGFSFISKAGAYSFIASLYDLYSDFDYKFGVESITYYE